LEENEMVTRTVVPNTYYGWSREQWAAIGQLIVRMRAASPNLPSLPKQFGFSRWSVLAIDALFGAVSAADHLQPSKMFDSHNWYLGRANVQALVQLEQRITNLGF
jgi:hypothetical protein